MRLLGVLSGIGTAPAPDQLFRKSGIKGQACGGVPGDRARWRPSASERGVAQPGRVSPDSDRASGESGDVVRFCADRVADVEPKDGQSSARSPVGYAEFVRVGIGDSLGCGESDQPSWNGRKLDNEVGRRAAGESWRGRWGRRSRTGAGDGRSPGRRSPRRRSPRSSSAWSGGWCGIAWPSHSGATRRSLPSTSSRATWRGWPARWSSTRSPRRASSSASGRSRDGWAPASTRSGSCRSWRG